jgi:DNA-binding transcriptional regulator PaaX
MRQTLTTDLFLVLVRLHPRQVNRLDVVAEDAGVSEANALRALAELERRGMARSLAPDNLRWELTDRGEQRLNQATRALMEAGA